MLPEDGERHMAQVGRGFNEDLLRVATLPLPWEKLRGKTVLISGGTGFLGSALIETLEIRNRLFGDDTKIISLSRRPRESRGNVAYLRADVNKPIAIDGDVDFVLHLASNTHPAQYASDPVGTITTNVFGCYNMLEVAREKKAERFLLASSVEIYGECGAEPVRESYSGYIDCNTSRAGYNESKRVSESLVQSYLAQYSVDSVIARLARCFGPDTTKKDTKAMSQFISSAINGNDVVLKSEGKQRYSYCYYVDAVSGILTALLKGERGQAYNVSDDDDGSTLADIASYICSCCNVKLVCDLEHAQVGASKATYALLDCDKLKTLGWEPLFTLQEGIKKTLDSLKETK